MKMTARLPARHAVRTLNRNLFGKYFRLQEIRKHDRVEKTTAREPLF